MGLLFFQNPAHLCASTIAFPMSDGTTHSHEVTTNAPDDSFLKDFWSGELIALIVLVSLCALMGAIYAYIYYTQINPPPAKTRHVTDTESTNQEQDKNRATRISLLLPRK